VRLILWPSAQTERPEWALFAEIALRLERAICSEAPSERAATSVIGPASNPNQTRSAVGANRNGRLPSSRSCRRGVNCKAPPAALPPTSKRAHHGSARPLVWASSATLFRRRSPRPTKPSLSSWSRPPRICARPPPAWPLVSGHARSSSGCAFATAGATSGRSTLSPPPADLALLIVVDFPALLAVFHGRRCGAAAARATCTLTATVTRTLCRRSRTRRGTFSGASLGRSGSCQSRSEWGAGRSRSIRGASVFSCH
jgi:hypothetical protein